MKAIEFKLRKSIIGYIMVLLALSTFVYTGCSKINEAITYTVTFDTDGGTPVPSVQSVKAGEMATAPTINLSKPGYVFLFWHLSGASTAYNFGIPINSNITLQAKWEGEDNVEYRQVSWELNGGAWPTPGDNHATQVVKGGTLAEPAAPVKSGNTFDGWYKEAALTNKISFPYDVSSVTANFTLYAKWSTGGGTTDPAGYKMFTSISELKSWLASQPDNSVGTAYKVGLKNINLDSNDGWNALGAAVKTVKYVDLNLKECTSTAIPDGYQESTPGKYPGEFTTTTYGAFIGCNYIVAVTLPKGLKTIGKWAFYKCSGLNIVTTFEGLTEIHDYAFHESNISSINFPEGLRIIGDNAFRYTKLTSATIPGSVTSVGSSAFNRCISLSTLVINEGVESIEQGAFEYCNSIQSLTLPQSLKTIKMYAFRNCNSMKSISLPAGLTIISEGVFYDCASLTSINIPDGVKTIERSAFYNCVKLSSIEISSTVTSIGNYAFSNTASNSTFVMRPATPPTLGSSALSAGSNVVIKVPATSVDAYKTAAGWSPYASRIVANTD
jgi:Listeria/Bacterioides repeat